MDHHGKVDVRDELIQRLKFELVGPNEEYETLDESPAQRYLTGILWPIGTEVGAEDDEGITNEDEGDDNHGIEKDPPLLQAMKPSSIGLSFVVEPDCKILDVNISWGAYERTEKQWKRVPVPFPAAIDIFPADGKRRFQKYAYDPDISLEWISRPLGNRYAVSLFIVNRRLAPEGVAKDSYCLFQPKIVVRDPNGGKPFSVRKLENETSNSKPADVRTDELLYRHQTEFAVGHGTAVTWNFVSADRKNAGQLTTETVPQHEVARVVPLDWTYGGSLEMNDLANATTGDELYNLLEPLADAYDAWIDERNTEVDDLTGTMRDTAVENVRQCRESLNRIRKGLDLTCSEPDVFAAFKFMNRAMSMQRTQSIWSKEATRLKDWSNGPTQIQTVWRPFQIAFILQALTGVVVPEHTDRELADLLWFPTGGGKTEAYLGLTAFTLALRRLRGEQQGLRGDAGVAVVMRYTLRLLTIQQFQRASTLICACEIIRGESPDLWGQEPFRIGLWVGGTNTPNDFDGCLSVLPPNKRKSQTTPTPVQLVSCPWCGSELKDMHYKADKTSRRVIIGCSRRDCEFHRTRRPEGIPAVMSDEEIYRLLPSLVIGTVDKFARLPFLGETQALFGKVRGWIPKWGFLAYGADSQTVERVDHVTKGEKNVTDARELLPPELIIQDELHLISGPLGTMVGLYETAIDWLCSRELSGKRVGPKVVASTATIRRAEDQVRGLFARRLAIFPSPALEDGESFFSTQQPVETVPGRTYVGVFAPGRSVKTALVRVYAALLGSTEVVNGTESDKDPYKTLVGYFNSLRELGGAVRLIEDDVPSRLNMLQKRTVGQRFEYQSRDLENPVPELTSRVDTSDIPGMLRRLEMTFDAENKEYKPVDVVLASNMISVGVDVSRLGLMVVTGQPKTTSEYIQATSRVGREFPGLVVTVYNWARPRDVSHYERFGSYHSALYRYVEAISVTPFSSRARDRALSAVLVTMTRLIEEELSGRDRAHVFRSNLPVMNSVIQAVTDRLGAIAPERTDEVIQHFKALADQWQKAAVRSSNLPYTNGKPKLLDTLGRRKKNGEFAIPNSMRDVEPTIGIYLKWS